MDKTRNNQGKWPCRLCGRLTISSFNINLQQVPICHKCALLITIQNVHSLAETAPDPDKEITFTLADKILKFCRNCDNLTMDERNIQPLCKRHLNMEIILAKGYCQFRSK